MTLSLVFTKNHHLVEFPPIMKKLQSNASKRTFSLCCDFRIEHVIWVLIIHRLFIYRLKKDIIFRTLLVHVLRHFFITCIPLRLPIMSLKCTFLASCLFLSITSMQIRNRLLKSYAKKLGIFIL